MIILNTKLKKNNYLKCMCLRKNQYHSHNAEIDKPWLRFLKKTLYIPFFIKIQYKTLWISKYRQVHSCSSCNHLYMTPPTHTFVHTPHKQRQMTVWGEKEKTNAEQECEDRRQNDQQKQDEVKEIEIVDCIDCVRKAPQFLPCLNDLFQFHLLC